MTLSTYFLIVPKSIILPFSKRVYLQSFMAACAHHTNT